MRNIEEKSDKEIVSLSLKNDKYFTQLVERYEAKLGRYIFRLARLENETTEDLLQEVFIKVYKNLNDFDDSFSFSSWIYRITHNEVMSFLRNMKVRPKIVHPKSEEVDTEFINLLPDDTDLPAELAKKELGEKVRDAVYNLPDKYREVLVLRYLEDKSYDEISDILRKSVNSVTVLVNRAKKRLKKQLNP